MIDEELTCLRDERTWLNKMLNREARAASTSPNANSWDERRSNISQIDHHEINKEKQSGKWIRWSSHAEQRVYHDSTRRDERRRRRWSTIGFDLLSTSLDELKHYFHDRYWPRRRSSWRFLRDRGMRGTIVACKLTRWMFVKSIQMRIEAKGKVEVKLSLQNWMIWCRWSSFIPARAVHSARPAATLTPCCRGGGRGGWVDSIWWRISSPNVSVCSRSLGDDVKSIRYSEFDISCRREFIQFSKIWNKQKTKRRSWERILFSFLLFSFRLIGRKQSFDLNVQRWRGFVLLELEIREGGKRHFQFAILIARSRLLHEENLLSSRILLDRSWRKICSMNVSIMRWQISIEWFEVISTNTVRLFGLNWNETIDVPLHWKRERETFVRSALVNGGREIICRSSSARKTNSGWFSTKVRYLIDRSGANETKNSFSRDERTCRVRRWDFVFSIFSVVQLVDTTNRRILGRRDSFMVGFPSGTSSIWFGSLASWMRFPLIEFQSCVPIVANVRFLSMPSWRFILPGNTPRSAIRQRKNRWNRPVSDRWSADPNHDERISISSTFFVFGSRKSFSLIWLIIGVDVLLEETKEKSLRCFNWFTFRSSTDQPSHFRSRRFDEKDQSDQD